VGQLKLPHLERRQQRHGLLMMLHHIFCSSLFWALAYCSALLSVSLPCGVAVWEYVLIYV
jgi:hypothetical protein